MRSKAAADHNILASWTRSLNEGLKTRPHFVMSDNLQSSTLSHTLHAKKHALANTFVDNPTVIIRTSHEPYKVGNVDKVDKKKIK